MHLSFCLGGTVLWEHARCGAALRSFRLIIRQNYPHAVLRHPYTAYQHETDDKRDGLSTKLMNTPASLSWNGLSLARAAAYDEAGYGRTSTTRHANSFATGKADRIFAMETGFGAW